MPTQNNRNSIFIGIIAVIIFAVIVFNYYQKNTNKADYQTPEVSRPYKGNSDAKLVITEFSDFACPACGQAAPVVAKLVGQYKDKVKFEYRHFPLTSLHSNAFAAAVGAECANDQDKFWDYHDKLFAVNNNTSFTSENLKKYAQEVGLDMTKWQNCVDSEERDKVVKQDQGEARVLKLTGTPSFLINGSLIKDWTKLDQIIELELGYLNKKN